MSTAELTHEGSAPAGAGRRGMALMMAIVITGVCMVIVAGLMQYIIGEYKATFRDWRRVQAIYCAESGIDTTVYLLTSNPGMTTLSEIPLANLSPGAEGTFEARVEPVTSNGVTDPGGAVRITATGYVPNKAAPAATHTVTAVYAAPIWDFGADAVRARAGITYASNDFMTVVVDENYNVVDDPSVDASIRVTGTGATVGAVDSIAANKAKVSGSVIAPGFVDVRPQNAYSVSELDPNNFMENAFPPANELGTWDAAGNLMWPPTPGTWASTYYKDALAGGTTTLSTGTFTGSKFIDLGGTGTLTNAILTGPGTVFVRGNVGGNVTNGSPPVTLVASGNLFTDGGEVYRSVLASGQTQAPPFITFGMESEIRGTSEWYLNGPLMAMNPQGHVLVNDSAITCFGALISNGTVEFKSSQGALGYPRILANAHYTAKGSPRIISYAER